jgi:hypothetical protein
MNTQKSCSEANAHAVRPHAAWMAIGGKNPTNPTQPLSLFCARPSRKWAFQQNYTVLTQLFGEELFNNRIKATH